MRILAKTLFQPRPVNPSILKQFEGTRAPIPKGSMYPYSIDLALKVVPI